MENDEKGGGAGAHVVRMVAAVIFFTSSAHDHTHKTTYRTLGHTVLCRPHTLLPPPPSQQLSKFFVPF